MVVSHLCLLSGQKRDGSKLDLPDFSDDDLFREQWLVQPSPLGETWGPLHSHKYY